MRIAQVAPLLESVPPPGYGGIERMVSYLTEEQAALGHDVTLFASGDSLTNARLVAGSRTGLRSDPACDDPLPWLLGMLHQVVEQSEAFDLIHFHTGYVHLPFAGYVRRPALTTMHDRMDRPDAHGLYRAFRTLPYVSISLAQQQPVPWLNWIASVQHGIPANLYGPGPERRDYLAFVGRMSREKGVEAAIEIACRTEVPLRIAAKIGHEDRAYFDAIVRPKLSHPLVEYVGEIGDEDKQEFLGGALALLFPIDWPEPFGLVMIEAMACGTPVIAFPRGSVPELVEHGRTGMIVETVDEAVEAVTAIQRIERTACRGAFEERFTSRRMAEDYLTIYERLTEEPHRFEERGYRTRRAARRPAQRPA